MLKQKVSYEDFDGNTQTEELYFNLNRMELLAFQQRYGSDNMEKYINQLIEDKKVQPMYDLLNDFVLTAYGIKS